VSGAGLARIKRWRILAPFRVLRARPQLVASVLLGLLIGYLLPSGIGVATRVLIAWNIAVLFYFLLALILHSGATHESIRATAQRLDEGRAAILLLITAATIASFVAIVLHLGDVKTTHGAQKVVGVGLTAATVVNSWLLLHLSFAFHYAHEYYTEEARAPYLPPQTRGGLNFPATRAPQYIDFLYFSYVIGVACQTADVEICSPTMRAVALFHGVVSFFFNTTILALLVNIASQFV
jgi:uncharacterized membrane protein